MITYLLGAGASSETLPLAGKLRETLIHFRDAVQSHLNGLNNPKSSFTTTKAEFVYGSSLKIEIENVLEKSSGYKTIDAYAKTLLYSKEKLEYIKLKNILCLLFEYMQAGRPAEKKYNQFLTTLLIADDLEMPDNIRILTWNYDYQIEKAYSVFTKSNDLSECTERLSLGLDISRISSSTKIVKLNGSSIPFDVLQLQPVTTIFGLNDPYDPNLYIPKLICMFEKLTINNTSTSTLINYAWETQPDDVSTKLKKIGCDDTDTLVIIGYSFPDYNREHDISILKTMPFCSKVYIQIPDNFSEEIINKVKDIWPNRDTPDFIPRKDVSQFFIPNSFFHKK